MASVIHGFIYNKDAFDELGLKPPTTEDEFFAVLDKIKADGTYIPMAMGTNDQWEAATMGYQNIGPNYWKGEEGRLALIEGTQKLTDPQCVAPFRELARWKDYLGDGFEAQTYPDSQNLFTLGRAAIYPAGSWEIAPLQRADAAASRWAPSRRRCRRRATPATSPTTSTSRMGMNADVAERRGGEDIPRMGRPRRSSPTLYANALPGFFSLHNERGDARGPARPGVRVLARQVRVDDPLAYQILSRGTPNLENETWNASANVVRGTETPEAAASGSRRASTSWYKPGK